MLKSFLVAVDGSAYSAAAVGYAVALARREEARITLLHVIDVVSLEGPFLADLSGIVGVVPYLDLQQQVREALLEKGKVILEGHAETVRAAGLGCATRIETGVVSRVICEASATHDAIVVGRRGEHATWSGFLLGSTVEEVVRGCAKPVLVTPQALRPVTRILAAYDGSRTANRALGVAATFAAGLDLPLVVVCVSTDEREGRRTLDEAEAYLEPHRLRTKAVLETGAPVDGIIQVAQREACDLVIMGAWGHSRVRELILGSTTDGILRSAEVPLLLYR
jgi:nucleotide-binding universal stress UspA family protein